MKNTIEISNPLPSKVKVETLEGGTLVRSSIMGEERIYVVLVNKSNPARITAVSLVDGGYLSPGSLVVPMKSGEKATITAGGSAE
jgi:hypothetical protein